MSVLQFAYQLVQGLVQSKNPANKVLKYSQNIELYLLQNFSAKGRGITEMLNSVGNYFQPQDDALIRRLAAQRNRAVHLGIDRIDIDQFERDYRLLIQRIRSHYPKTVWDYSDH